MITRRDFIKSATLTSAIALSKPTNLFSDTSNNGLCIVSFSDKKDVAHFVSIKTGKTIFELNNFHVSHAVVVVESNNRIFLHGKEQLTNKASIACFEADLKNDKVKLIDKKILEGGNILHWQPNKDYSKIQYNTIKDGKIHVLNTNTLKLKSYAGGGKHSNMAWANNDKLLIVSDKMRGMTTVNVINSTTGELLSSTKTASWAHGLTCCDKKEMAFIWTYDGVHKINLKGKTVGKHLGIIKPIEKDVRSWFCWTPQGGRFSHDQSWGDGDDFKPYLTVIDMEKEKLFKIESPNQQLGTLQVSPDGLWGAAGSHNSDQIQVFNITDNIQVSSIKAGKSNGGFFDRDLAFSKNRKLLFTTNTKDKSISMINLANKETTKTISLQHTPKWMKVLA